jgi:hypothetical protein
MNAPDLCIAWLNVHGGSFHKLIRLHEGLCSAGITCELFFSTSPPRGLKVGVDAPPDTLADLERRGVFLLPRQEVLRRAEASKARLLLTDAHHDPDLPDLIASARLRGAVTAQMATLLGDFTCHGAEHLLIQHPLTLFFELEFNRTRESARFFEALSITCTGNIFFEPTLNQLHGGYASREAFYQKYGFDPSRPLCLWLPSAPDVRDESYTQVAQAVRASGHNLAVKLHPWEYAFKKHGPPHPWGLGQSSDALWGVTAVDEADTTWAYHFCDAAILRASAMGLEMPFWKRPALILPSSVFPEFFNAQAALVASSAVQLPSVGALETFLTTRPLPKFQADDFAQAQAATRLDLAHDAYELTVQALVRLLGGDTPERLSPTELRRLYDPHVTPELLRSLPPLRRLRATAGRLRRRFFTHSTAS